MRCSQSLGRVKLAAKCCQWPGCVGEESAEEAGGVSKLTRTALPPRRPLSELLAAAAQETIAPFSLVLSWP